MAMPVNFWRDEQKLEIFKTKPCQRLLESGVCNWKSRCQYSHCLEWPRRQLRKYKYSPEVCPHVKVLKDESGDTNVVSTCPQRMRCNKAHSKEEVLYHPDIFKTFLCQEYMGNTESKNAVAKRKRCHRFYCPFAHGQGELRESSLTEEQRNQCLRAIMMFPSESCCQVCTPYSHRTGEEAQDTEGCSSNEAGLSISSMPNKNHRNKNELIASMPDLNSQLKNRPLPPPPVVPCSRCGEHSTPPGLPAPPPLHLLESLGGLSTQPPPFPFVDPVNDPLRPQERKRRVSEPIRDVADTVPVDDRSPTYKLWGDCPVFVNVVGDHIVSVGPKMLNSTAQSMSIASRPFFKI